MLDIGYSSSKISRWHSVSRGVLLAWLAAVAGAAGDPLHSADQAITPRGVFERVARPLIKSCLVPLPPGAVEPHGWLRDWAESAANGVTGHLDEYHPVFADAWKGVAVKAPNAEADGTGWPLEQSSYWLDGLVRLGYILHDEKLIKKAKERLDLVVDGVNTNGTSFIYWQTKPPAAFNSWAHSHMGRALVAYYQATGDKRILAALTIAYGNYAVPMGSLDLVWINVSGLCNLDPLLETYSFTGDPRLLERAASAMQQANVQATVANWDQNQFNTSEFCHAVCANELIRLPGLFYPWCGEPQYLQATRNAYEWLGREHLQPYGVSSGEEFLSGIGAFHLTETCDVTARLWSSLWMLRVTGERAWGDDMELAFFNAAPAPIARDFKTMCYYQSPNRFEPESLPSAKGAPGPGCLQFTRLGHSAVLCCVGAVNRILPSYIMHMWMATEDGGLAATLYGPCRVTAFAGRHIPVTLDCETAYPFQDDLGIRVTPAQPTVFPLYLRVPAWCHQPRIEVNGQAVANATDVRGFVRLERTWSRGDMVTLKFPMSVQVIRGYETEYPKATRTYFKYKPDEVFTKRRLPYESIRFGPLLFALPIPDLDANTVASHVNWQFALDNLAANKGQDVTVERNPMPSRWDWPLAAPIVLKVPARGFDWHPTDDQALPPEPVTGETSQTISLIPYGCTKFRISMFPVTHKAWENPPAP